MQVEKRQIEVGLCIVGGGPAGIFGAIAAAENGVKAAIIEKNTISCRKLLYTGGKRCNFTHAGSIDDFVRACGQFGRFLKHALHEFSPNDLRNYFLKQGLESKVEKDGCVFPVTNRAADVARILTDQARRAGVNFLYDRAAEKIEKRCDHFVIETQKEIVSAAAVMIATGGMSWPFTGSTGDGYELARSLGHSITSPRGSLVPLITVEKWPGKLAGVSVPEVNIKAKLPTNKKISVSGSLIFTSEGIGGMATFDLSRHIADFLPADEPIKIAIDLVPGLGADELEQRIIELCSKNPKKELAGVLTEFLSRSLILNICGQINSGKTVLAGQLSKAMRKELVRLMKQLELSISDSKPIADATVTRGGVSTAEIDPKTMESKLCKGLFFAGEVIDVDGPCGGYNLQIAFSTGYLAGKSQRPSGAGGII